MRAGSGSGLDLAFDDAQQAIADALAQFCRDRCDAGVAKALEGKFPSDLWRELAELGVLALATREGEGGAQELVAANESLGRAVFPGPLAATFLATQILPEPECFAVARGESVVSVGVPPLLPWAPCARLFVEIDGERAHLCEPRGELKPVETLGGEPWGRVSLERVRDLGDARRGLCLYAIALAAYLAGAADALVETTAEHARTRRQFGRAIGEFQAVAHPLADCAIAVASATALARRAAWHFDVAAESGDEPDAETRGRAAAARMSAARAALETAHVSHQLFGALGITLEGPVFHVSRRIRQLASQPPPDAPSRDAVLAPYGL